MDNTYTYHFTRNSPSNSRSRPLADAGKKAIRKSRVKSLPPAVEPALPPIPRRRLPLLLRRAWFSLNQTFRRDCSRLGITPDQFTVLRTLHENEPMGLNQRDLAEQITSDPNTIAALLARMESNGLIARRTDPEDRRAHRLRLKPAGRRAFAKAHVLAKQLQEKILQSLPEHRREVFLEELEIIANTCHALMKQGRGRRGEMTNDE